MTNDSLCEHGRPEFVYAPSREEAQRLLDESYLEKFRAVPVDEPLHKVFVAIMACGIVIGFALGVIFQAVIG